MKYLFYLEPYTFLFRNKNKNVIYNTINSAYISCENSGNLKMIMDVWEVPSSGYRMLLDEELYHCEDINEFIKNVRNSFSGDCISWNEDRQCPFIFKPSLFLNSEIKTVKEKNNQFLGERILLNLHEVTFYLSTPCNEQCEFCRSYYKQFHHCTQLYGNMALEDYRRLLMFLHVSGVSKVNFIGGDLRENRCLETLLMEFSSSSFKKCVYVNYKHLENFNWDLMENTKTSVLVTVDEEDLMRCSKNVFVNSAQYCLIVSNELCLGLVTSEEMLRDVCIDKILPFYNGCNEDFFEKYVYLDLDDIIEEPIDRKTIYRHEVLNDNFFGKLYIMPTGDVFSNINMPSLGNIYESSLKEIVYKEILEGNVWLNNRANISPCDKCINRLLCPPISNYEIVLGRNNLCHAYSF